MNTKVLASLGVIVALLTAWLFVSLYSAANVQIKEVAPTPVEVDASASVPENSVGEGESQGVKTSVNVANTDVQTTVRVAE